MLWFRELLDSGSGATFHMVRLPEPVDKEE